MGQLLEEGTDKHSEKEIAQTIENVGGVLRMSGTGGTVKVLSPDRALGLGLMIECLTRPAFKRDAVKRLKEHLLSEIEDAQHQPGPRAQEEFLRLMELTGTVEIAMGTETAKLNVKGDDLGVLIGRRGEKLASLQHLVNLIIARREGQTFRIAIDVENYRGRREDQLRDVARRAAERVLQTGKIIQLEAMPAVERRIVHMALVENPGLDPNDWRLVRANSTGIRAQSEDAVALHGFTVHDRESWRRAATWCTG